MADKTDIWMPLYIGDFLAATSHLGATESGAYLLLLMHQWKNGRLPESSEALRRIARVESDAWSNAWAMLEDFFDTSAGYPVQMRLEAIREEANGKKAKYKAKAENAAKARWEKDAPSNATSNPQAMPQPCPSPSSSPTKKEQKPSRDKREGDPRHVSFKAAVMTYGAFKGVKLPWDASEAKALDMTLKSLPDMTVADFQACLNARARSPGTPHGERPRVWLPHITKYQQGPLNEFGKTGEASGTNKGKTESSVDAARTAIAILHRREADGYYGTPVEAGGAEAGEIGTRGLLGSG